MKKQLIRGLASVALTAGMTAPALADLSATAGFVSDYVYRGKEFGNAGAYFSVDYENSGFFAGTWAIMDGGTAGEVEDGEVSTTNLGAEVDYYVGYGMEFDSGLNFSLGYTAYTYTYSKQYIEDFEDEVGGSLGYGAFAVSAYYGWAHSSEDGVSSYTYWDLSWSGDVFGVLVGGQANEDDSTYTYAEVSASGEVASLDMALTVGSKFMGEDADGNDLDTSADAYIVLDISKTFSL